MGIPGLTTYISNHADRYLEYYELHDTYLVIDGNSIACQLYMWHARCNCAFGGDYDKYAKCVSDFFDELLICNVTPLVLLDGGCEEKKLQTVISRTREKIGIASYYTFSLQSRSKFFPLLLKEVFKDVMKEKKIKYVQCLFEADNTIAAIARILNCPVLSYDSDFYIYGSLYIPFSTWESKVAWSLTGAYHVKRCKIYYTEKLFRAFTGLNQSLLPLAAVLLGNDYVKQRTFKNFFHHLKLPSTGRKMYNDQQRRIDATFHWLRKQTLNQAITGILSRLRKTERKYVLNIIEMIINGYINASLSVLHMLGVPAHKFSKACILEASRTYKFEGNIYNLTYVDERKDADRNDDSDEAGDQEIMSLIEENELTSNESLVNCLPQWFIDEFKLGRYPSYFIDIIVRKLYICPVQIEDHIYAPSIVASLKIISIIYGLLLTGVEERKTISCMKYITRDKNKKIKRYQLEYHDSLLGCTLPSLANLRELPILIRREILNSTLGIDGGNKINGIPSNWMLYIATIKYWLDQQEEPYKLACHVYSLLFAMLFNVIDQQLGYYRNLNKFHHNYNAIVRYIQESRKMCNYRPQYSVNHSIVDAYHEITMEDCLLAAPFFLCNFETDQKLYHQPKKFNITIVHGFAEFQNCLRHSMNLNALLGYPYDQIKVASVFNGTLLYNLCSNFKTRNVVEVYINTILQNSPSLLHFFNALLSQIKPLLVTALETAKYKKRENRSKRHKRNNTTQEEETKKKLNEEEKETKETEESISDGGVFHDVNNPFSVLGSAP